MTVLPRERLVFDAARLIEAHPLRFSNPNKQVVLEQIRSAGDPFEGSIGYARWRAAALPERVTARVAFELHRGAFSYPADEPGGAVAWHMNFADPELFAAWNSSLLAQDELQVAEHPILGSLRQALVAQGKRPRTVDAQGGPAPITISGVQRRCAIDISRNPRTGRSLYGNAFARAAADEVRAAVRVLSPPTISHILAMAAPACGRGSYTREELLLIAGTAYAGYLGARVESAGLAGAAARTVIHTGFWGCGAFGGNRAVMTMLQALAAELADVDLIYHVLDDEGHDVAGEAQRRYESLRDAAATVPQFLEALCRLGLPWGRSDGN